MSKYNILFVCHDFPPYKYAGAQLYAMNLALAINKTGLANVEIFTQSLDLAIWNIRPVL